MENARLLVVDDEPNIRELLTTSLRFAGFDVIAAADGNEAIRQAREGDPDLIVLDVMLPDMDGFTVTRRLRDTGQHTPVLFLTARDDVSDKLTGLTLKDTVTGETRELDATGLFIAIGHDPRSELLPGQVDLDDEGYVLAEGRSTRTNLAGVFACGDLVDHTYRQAITAAGSGCAAALDAERYLADLEHAEASKVAATV